MRVVYIHSVQKDCPTARKGASKIQQKLSHRGQPIDHENNKRRLIERKTKSGMDWEFTLMSREEAGILLALHSKEEDVI